MDESEQKNAQLLLYLISSFEMTAMHQMGKLKNPMLDKIERNLEQAQFTIDLLDMLQAKTKGNLSADEEKFIEHVIAQLKLNYVEEMEKDKKEKQTAASEAEKNKPKDEETNEGTKTV